MMSGRPVERVPPDQVLLDLQAEYRACEARLNSLRRARTVTTAGLMPLILELKQIQLQAHARRGPGKPPSRYATRPRLRNCERAGALRRAHRGAHRRAAARGIVDERDGGGLVHDKTKKRGARRVYYLTRT